MLFTAITIEQFTGYGIKIRSVKLMDEAASLPAASSPSNPDNHRNHQFSG
jgi:hypothetical protein